MRALISKVLTGSMIAGAALMVSACGGNNESTATENTTVTDLNATEGSMDTMTDNMTAVDGASNTGMMANDTMMMGNDSMSMGNDTTMSTNTTTSTTTTNAQ